MADLVFTALVAIRSQVANEIGRLSLPKNESGQYTHANITQLKKGIERILKQQYNPARGDHGMLAILSLNNYGPKAHRRRRDQHVQEGGRGGVHRDGYDGAP
jgi:hypothetical protein